MLAGYMHMVHMSCRPGKQDTLLTYPCVQAARQLLPQPRSMAGQHQSTNRCSSARFHCMSNDAGHPCMGVTCILSGGRTTMVQSRLTMCLSKTSSTPAQNRCNALCSTPRLGWSVPGHSPTSSSTCSVRHLPCNLLLAPCLWQHSGDSIGHGYAVRQCKTPKLYAERALPALAKPLEPCLLPPP